MILTVTANPAWDVTYRVDELTPGSVHRVRAVHERPGGKGVNVASVLAQLGADVTACGLATPDFATAVEGLGVRAAFVSRLPRVRRTVTVMAGDEATSLWEPGWRPDEPAAARVDLLATVDTLLTFADVLVVSGSLPPGLDPELVLELASLGRGRGVPTVVDTSGPALERAVQVEGVVVLPNAEELAELAGSGPAPVGLDEVVGLSHDLLARGVTVVATRGASGLVATGPDGCWEAAPPDPLTGNPTGAGDAAAAAVALGLSAGRPLDEIAADAVALSAAAVAHPVAGRIDEAVHAAVRDEVRVRRLAPADGAVGR